MPDEPRPPVPAPRPLDRTALERVLARASELQAGSADAPDELTEAQLLELGNEVGIPAQHLRQALAEERTRVAVPPETGLAARLAGPAMAMATRVVPGTPAAVLAALDAWMQREECLQVRRKYTDRITWEARRDFLGNIKRGFNLGGRGYLLTRAEEVGATVSVVDDKRVLVRLDANLEHSRALRLRTGGAAALGGAGVGGAGLVMATSFHFLAAGVVPFLAAAAVAAVPALLGAGVARQLARGHAAAVTRAQLALEQVLDRLEHGDMRTPTRPIDAIATVAARLLK